MSRPPFAASAGAALLSWALGLSALGSVAPHEALSADFAPAAAFERSGFELLADVPIDNFHEVAPAQIYRGARPDAAGMAALARLGVRTVLDLENNEGAIARERKLAGVLGLELLSIPFSAFWSPSDEKVDQALGVLSDPSRYPVFVHCQFGKDRTGLIVGLHRVEQEEWDRERAYAEMKKYGFHRELLLLRQYFMRRTQDAAASQLALQPRLH